VGEQGQEQGQVGEVQLYDSVVSEGQVRMPTKNTSYYLQEAVGWGRQRKERFVETPIERMEGFGMSTEANAAGVDAGGVGSCMN
jgi:hypothetical protein